MSASSSSLKQSTQWVVRPLENTGKEIVKLTGQHFIAGRRTASITDKSQAINPANSEMLDVHFAEASATEIDEALVVAIIHGTDKDLESNTALVPILQ